MLTKVITLGAMLGLLVGLRLQASERSNGGRGCAKPGGGAGL